MHNDGFLGPSSAFRKQFTKCVPSQLYLPLSSMLACNVDSMRFYSVSEGLLQGLPCTASRNSFHGVAIAEGIPIESAYEEALSELSKKSEPLERASNIPQPSQAEPMGIVLFCTSAGGTVTVASMHALNHCCSMRFVPRR